jgi:hypothetical protein
MIQKCPQNVKRVSIGAKTPKKGGGKEESRSKITKDGQYR